MSDPLEDYPEITVNDEVYKGITLYTVGFLALARDDKGRPAYLPCGSGVLADIGGVRGIITAAHVLRELDNFEEAALFTIVNQSKKVRPLTFEVSAMAVAMVGGRDRTAEGPDLAFVQMPLKTHEHLLAASAFYNYAIRWVASGVPKDVEGHLLSGVLAERTETVEVTAGGRTDRHAMVHGGGVIDHERMASNGFDLFDFHFNHGAEVRRPNSYGGLSGSAIWRTTPDGQRDDRLIYGIAFYESAQDADGNRIITCHGPESLYIKLTDMVARRFAPQFTEFRKAQK